MQKIHKTAIARIFSDLIKTDRIIDSREMECWQRVSAKYDIGKEEEIEAMGISFADAIRAIRSANDPELQEALLADCRSLTVSDGFRAHSEALIIIALMLSLDPDAEMAAEIFSIPRANFNIDIATSIYIENSYDKEINDVIRTSHRVIFKELQLAGFHFIYLPNIIDHYRRTDPALMRQMLSFLAPSLSDAGIERIYSQLLKMTTGYFCKDILCNKCGITDLRSTYPSLLIKISNSYVGDSLYSNYLKLEVAEDIVQTVQRFTDDFCDLLSSDIIVVHTSEEKDNQFHYHGFYKQLLDIFLVRKNIRSSILLDPYKSEILFPEIDVKATGLHRRERALYALLLCQGADGLDFSSVGDSAESRAISRRRIGRIQARYAEIYEMFGGERENAPDLSLPEIRRPIFACLRRALKNLPALYNPEDYNITRDRNGVFSVNIEPQLVSVAQLDSDTPVPLTESTLYRRVRKI